MVAITAQEALYDPLGACVARERDAQLSWTKTHTSVTPSGQPLSTTVALDHHASNTLWTKGTKGAAVSTMKSARLALGSCLIMGAAGVLALDASPAAAQPQTTVTTETTQTRETTPATQTTQVPTVEPTPDRVMGIVVLALGAVALAILFAYLEAWRRAYVKLSRAALKMTGSFPVPIDVLATVPVPGPPGRAQAGQAPELVIKGPTTVFVGRPSDAFTALVDGNEVEASWTVREPEARIAPARGRSARITVTRSGPFTVVAQAAGTEITAVVTAVTPPSPGAFPLIASGYAGSTIAIVAICVAGALTAIGWLPGAALATLLGTVVAYFFVQQTNSATRGEQRSGDVTRPPQ